MNIKNPDAERLTRELAAATGESLTEAVTVAVQERLDRVRSGHDDDSVDDRIAAVQRLSREISERLTGPFATEDHGDLLSDERGLPR